MMKHFLKIGLAISIGLAGTSGAWAKLSTEEAAQLGIEGTPLTPMGAERAGNAEGTIPAWTGGLKEVPSEFVPGGAHVDPFPNDQPLFTITAQNYQQYAGNLTAGQVAMFKRYPDSWVMNVYPSRRTAGYDDAVYEATMKTAQSIEVCGERCLTASTIADGGGIPFPIPKTGWEALMNTNSAFYGKVVDYPGNSIVVTPSGDYSITQLDLQLLHTYWMTAAEKPSGPFFDRKGGPWWCMSAIFNSPSRSAGQILNGCGFMHDMRFDSYIYIPGQRRVRKAPEVGFYDQPAQGTDGLMTAHSRNGMYMSGSDEWFDFELQGKHEIFMPYNNYRIIDPKVTADDVVRPGHVNPALVRYELHRAWKVEATLREGFRNLQPRHVFYSDEDSWSSPLAERYNQQGEFWRQQERLLTYFYEPKAVFSGGTVAYDVLSGRWSSAIDSFPSFGGKHIDFDQPGRFDLVTPQGIRMLGRR